MRLRKYAAIARASLSNLLAYRARIASMLLFYALILFVFTCLWRSIYRGTEIAGYSFEQMIWYLCCTEMIAMGGRTRTFAAIGEDIRSGAVAYQLGRPYHFVGYHFAVSAVEILVNLGCVSTLGVALGFALAGPIHQYQALGIPLGGLSLLLGVGMQFFMNMSAALTALWIEDASGVHLLLGKLVFILGTFLPLELLPGWLQRIARALPFSYIAWGPARLVVAFDWATFRQIVPLQAFWLALLIGLSLWLCGKGMRSLEAHGG